MSELTTFSFLTSERGGLSHDVRVVDQNGEPWFILRDVLRAMGSSTPTTVAKESIEQGLGRGFNDVIPLTTAGGTQKLTVVSEPAVTLLVSRSNTDQGRKLNRWIHSEVLPSIRKTGRYSVPQPTLPDFNDPVAAARAWADAKESEQQALVQLEAAKPAVEYHARVASTNDAHTIDEAAKILRAGPRKFRQWLKDNKMLRLDGLPNQDLINRGIFKLVEKSVDLPTGQAKMYAQTYITGKGMQYLQLRVDHNLMGMEI